MLIEIAKLKDSEKRPVKGVEKLALLEKLSDRSVDWKTKAVSQTLFHVNDNIEGSHFHKNYMECLEMAWGGHYGVMMSPDIIWYTLLCELALIVGKAPDKYARLFTTTPGEKQEISVHGAGSVLPLDLIIDELRTRVPTDIDVFLPEFTTTNRRAEFSRYVAFADMVAPYYNYSMYMCGIPVVDVRGSVEDWVKVATYWKSISNVFGDNEPYFAQVQSILNSINDRRDDPEFWLGMFNLVRCGSGGQVEASGWFTDLFLTQPRVRYTYNYSSHLSKVSYTNLSTKENFRMFSGIMSSQLRDNILVPDFSCAVYRIAE